MKNLAEHTASIAKQARKHASEAEALDWWKINTANGTFGLFVHPPMLQSQVQALYPGCGVLRSSADDNLTPPPQPAQHPNP